MESGFLKGFCDVVKFDYGLDMKVEKKKKSFYILGYQLDLITENLAIWNFFPLKFGQFWQIVPRKILCIGRNHIFQVEI
jgi:hypothetical protein